MTTRASILPAFVLLSALSVSVAEASTTLVICAPGYPSSTKEAQPSMDVLAAAVSKSAGWPASAVAAEYFETEQGGIDRLRAKAPSIALVPLPFYLAHAGDLRLTPRAQAVPKGGDATETWTLVAKRGRVTSPASLAGFSIVSLAAYAPDFIRAVVLGRWGPLPADVTFVESGQVLSALRRAAGGEPVAVLLDASQTASLKTLPFASALEPVATSAPVPAIVVCTVGASVPPSDAKRLIAGLLRLHETDGGRSALDTVRMSRFTPLDERALAATRSSYAAASKPPSP